MNPQALSDGWGLRVFHMPRGALFIFARICYTIKCIILQFAAEAVL